MFQGHFSHTIDGKGRLSIPADFRVLIQGKGKTKAKTPTLSVLPDCLALYPADHWEQMADQFNDARAIDPEAQALKRFVLSNAYLCPIDKPGRITVPQDMRDYAGLEREVTVAGVGSHIELWNKSRYEMEMAKVRVNFDRLSLSVARSQQN